ncbi:histidinol-phosphatase HisJ family protein [Massiliimalia massiliensis]|uniref:histidinol-phosphatase HisJ family protein n=1 Tax=Massiliimalia massiliensis TaxID=1852384 RepID=UPI00135665CA|nr:histidinol-phosphatase HisJ family protein [Massiliimalia massiliensis]
MKRIVADYHMHTTVSPDGANTMEEMCEAAIQKGIREVAFTDHFEIFSPDFKGSCYSPIDRFTLEYWQRYVDAFARCKEKYGDRFSFKSGIELGQPHLNPKFSEKVLSMMPLDFVLGSLHKAEDTDFSERDYLAGRNEDYCRMNLEELYRLADEGDFDTLAHIDLIKRYAARQGVCVTLMDYKAEFACVLKRLIERGKGIEINTSGLRQGMGEAIPCMEILRFYHELGGEILTIGSDAHCAEDIAADFDTAYEMAKEAGFRAIALYTQRKCSFYDID